MIFGVFSCSSERFESYLNYKPVDENSAHICSFQVRTGGFEGGFILNDHLPYVQADFCYTTSDITVLFSGSIYNKEEVASNAKINPAIPLPELIAGLYTKDGPGFVSGLNGDFAICIAVHSPCQLLLYRDHVGIRPISWSFTNGFLVFSSDLNTLSSFLAADESIDSEYLTGYFRYTNLSSTPNCKVRRLQPGHWLKFDKRGIEIVKYWKPEKITRNRGLTYDQMINDLSYLLADSVRIRCDEKFTAGAHVSGGLDSGVVAALSRKEYSRQRLFHGFSLSPVQYSFKDIPNDERLLVRNLCQGADIVPVFSDMAISDFIRYTGNYHSNIGFFADDRIVEQARGLNVNLIFSGWGGDEFISTGSRSIEADLFWRMQFGIFFSRHPVTKPRRLLQVFIRAVLLPSLGIIDADLSRSLKDDARYLKNRYRKSSMRAIRAFYMHSSRRSHHLGMLSHYHLQERCEAWYVNGWRSGIEFRYPLLDRRIIEYMLGIPSELMCREKNPRPLLRIIAKGLIPDEIRLNRSKVDPVYRDFIGQIFVEAGKELSGEFENWRSNRDLDFIDFDMIQKDLLKWHKDTSSVDGRALFRAVVYISALHEFSRWYHRQGIYEV